MLQADCDMIIGVGFLLGDAMKADGQGQRRTPTSRSSTSPTRTSPTTSSRIIYDTAQGAFLAGYLAAGTTETGKVATYGGAEIPTVTIFMDGFADGVEYYNEQKGADVEVLGWDNARPERLLHRRLREPGRRQDQHHRTSSTRARTSSCPWPARWAWAPWTP